MELKPNNEPQPIEQLQAAIAANPMLADVVGVSEKSFQKMINAKYNGNCLYKLSNAFIFKENWESDFFVVKNNGYCYEFEIKISRSDFFNDSKKKTKQEILSTGKYTHYNGISEHKFRPNKMFYVVPKDMIKVNEIPSYAGLMYVDGYNLVTIKDAPFIHKDKLKLEEKLCMKFYSRWIDEKISNRILKNLNEKIQRRLDAYELKYVSCPEIG